MSWNFDAPLNTLSDSAKNESDKVLWEAEDLGGITEDNNRVPVPIVWLVFLTVITAFAITFPLWGQRPTAAIYVDYVKAMNDPEVQAAATDADAMAKIEAKVKASPDYAANAAMLERHPVSMNDLRLIAPEVQKLLAEGVDMHDYEVVGPDVVLANFEGNRRANGTIIRQQPWWDKGYTIDIFYVIYFFTFVTLVIKRLPPSSWQPTHGHEHK